MGAFRVLLGSLHYMGLYMQLSVSTKHAGHGEVENHISGNGFARIGGFRALWGGSSCILRPPFRPSTTSWNSEQ
ncbi:hypothetical protein NQZ68_000702 [Dissostichus eleginoides]|nr:hypothetical protein NQZ68_000702 [Dissostichus eleginoides]